MLILAVIRGAAVQRQIGSIVWVVDPGACSPPGDGNDRGPATAAPSAAPPCTYSRRLTACGIAATD